MHGMVNVASSQCEADNCTTRPRFGFEGESAKFCGTHKMVGMVVISSNICEEANCMKAPNFGFEGESARFCNTHKLGGMVNVTAHRCEVEYCTTVSSFGFDGESARFCDTHKMVGMVNVTAQRCEVENCTTQRRFGFEGERARFCNTHKLDGMVNVFGPQCEMDNCTTAPSFGFDGESARFCGSHKLDGMINVKSMRCPGPPCGGGCPGNIIINGSPSGFCLACDPDETRRLSRKRAEARFFKALEAAGLPAAWREVHVDYKCLTASDASHCFLDGVIDAPGVRIVCELDEHYHAAYDVSCEVRREQDATAALLLQDEEARAIAWVRVNPHASGDWSAGPNLKLEKQRHAEAVELIRGLIEEPRGGVWYLGYPAERVEELVAARLLS
jgi:hypothetical protein